MLDRVLPVEDEEISAFAHKQFEKQRIKLRTSAHRDEAQEGQDNVTATSRAGGKSEEITVDRAIMAVGIAGNVENLGLEGRGSKSTAPTS